MSEEPELEAMSTVYAALQKLDDEAAQTRVLKWVAEKLKLNTSPVASPEPSVTPIAGGGSGELQKSADLWARQNSITPEDLEAVFHRNGNELNVIAAEIPGKSTRERALNTYVLAGARSMVAGGDGSFTDKEARALCENFGCLDVGNHTKYLGDKGNEFTGSKDKGWTLTGPGKRRAALLVKEIAQKGG